ncbi:MAG: hypothetical protein FIA97_08530 [Methylococcaceae bacterium]|nr:hypothetical protein [Methylococcaceae bacterium]
MDTARSCEENPFTNAGQGMQAVLNTVMDQYLEACGRHFLIEVGRSFKAPERSMTVQFDK